MILAGHLILLIGVIAIAIVIPSAGIIWIGACFLGLIVSTIGTVKLIIKDAKENYDFRIFKAKIEVRNAIYKEISKGIAYKGVLLKPAETINGFNYPNILLPQILCPKDKCGEIHLILEDKTAFCPTCKTEYIKENYSQFLEGGREHLQNKINRWINDYHKGIADESNPLSDK